jgi:uncharacterized damage-inducible protein DinB
MTSLTEEVRRLMQRELETFAREVEMFPDDQSPWRTLPGVTNSAGNLARHVCGNLKHYVGAVLGGTGYLRHRDAEFAAREGSRSELAAELRETSAVVASVLPRVPEGVLAAPFPEAVGGVVPRCDRFLLHLCTHLAFHMGQAGYLRRALTGDARPSGAVAVKRLVDP